MTLQERLDKMEPRERALLRMLGIAMVGMVFLVIPIWLISMVGTRQDENQELRDTIATIEENRDKIASQRSEHDAMLARYARPAPPLAGLIEEAARKNNLALAESQNKPDVPHGKIYTERVTTVTMHKVGLLPLSKTLEKIAQSPHPVAITKLSIRPRPGEPDSYEVQMGVSAYDRKAPEKKKTEEEDDEDDGQ